MTMRKGKVFLKNRKQTEQDNPCLWFLLYFYFAFPQERGRYKNIRFSEERGETDVFQG